MDILRDRLAKAEAKVVRAEKALESAKTEHFDLQTTLRVMQEITGDSPPSSNAVASAAVAQRQQLITMLLGVGSASGKAPADVFTVYRAASGEDITIDTFRTTIWRMKEQRFTVGNEAWSVKGENGLYWKEPVPSPARAAPEALHTYDDFDEDPPF